MTLDMDLSTQCLDFDSLRKAYHSGLRPEALIKEVYRRIGETDAAIWTQHVPEPIALAAAAELNPSDMGSLPLFGIPFSVKDNIHVQGLHTSAGCPAYDHLHDASSASVVQMAIEAGAILIGKNSMDEFATGLVGVRSNPHPVNPFDSRYIPGGSSSGSAVAVACGLVSFSLGTDTGGSGRVPAALNNIVGLKSTPGVISNDGLVYAHKSFDCIPIFALTCSDADDVFKIIRKQGYISLADSSQHACRVDNAHSTIRVGTPAPDQLNFFGDMRNKEKYADAIETVRAVGWDVVEVDFEPFRKAGELLFKSSLIAERYSSIGEFVDEHCERVNAAVRQVISKAHDYSAIDVFNDYVKLDEYKQVAYMEFNKMDIMLVPTTGTIYTVDEVNNNPITFNNNMGYYTYFANLLRLPVIAAPCGIRSDNLPFGVSFVAAPGCDDFLIGAVKKFEKEVGFPAGVGVFG